jgi:hypothetical protein
MYINKSHGAAVRQCSSAKPVSTVSKFQNFTYADFRCEGTFQKKCTEKYIPKNPFSKINPQSQNRFLCKFLVHFLKIFLIFGISKKFWYLTFILTYVKEIKFGSQKFTEQRMKIKKGVFSILSLRIPTLFQTAYTIWIKSLSKCRVCRDIPM